MKAKHIVLMLLVAAMPFCASAQKRHVKKANEQTAEWRYEIEPTELVKQGSVTVKVWSFSKKPAVAQEQARKNAVHGVIFKGVAAGKTTPARKALAASTAGHEAFFDAFFADGGEFGRFVALTNSGAMGAGDVIRSTSNTNKKEYKVGVLCTVAYDQLRAYLESQGVIKGLGAGLF